MILVNRETEEVLCKPKVAVLGIHYDKGENKTLVFMGDREVARMQGEVDPEECDKAVKEVWIMSSTEDIEVVDPDIIVNEEALLADVEICIAEVLEVEFDEVAGKVPAHETAYILEKMFEVESEMIHRLAHQMVREGVIKIEE
ncbi:MAG: hypothetical protein DRN17_06535 [Thermoplasmata archaeon]|nr:MAG: hypothetical protein DRN17_06535 [Thermoplasmata archaeon]